MQMMCLYYGIIGHGLIYYSSNNGQILSCMSEVSTSTPEMMFSSKISELFRITWIDRYRILISMHVGNWIMNIVGIIILTTHMILYLQIMVPENKPSFVLVFNWKNIFGTQEMLKSVNMTESLL